jgi:hypothetical protein
MGTATRRAGCAAGGPAGPSGASTGPSCRAQGETLGSLRHGRGVHTCSNGDRYEGEWRYDRRHGKGRMEFTRGLTYDGQWVEDKTHG